ncbi:unnamed protein product [Orchesella dallaii]|uniref:Gustatory receptor n=1 Tax=Orchesella dallaii TaxID=48710 RepID=A0ABP1PWN1_9HEXA
MFISRNNSPNEPNTSDIKSRDIISDPRDPFITNTIINGGKWVFFSNSIVAFWPFSIKRTEDTRQKYLSFQYPTITLCFTVFYLILSTLYLVHYFMVRFLMDLNRSHLFDLTVVVVCDCTIIVVAMAYRIIGIWRLPQLRKFWDNIVNIVGQFTLISSEEDTQEKIGKLNKWSLKWIIFFTILGICNAIALFYDTIIISNIPLRRGIIMQYFDAVISMHNSSAFFLTFFIKIMSHGFTTCKRKLEQISRQSGRISTSTLSISDSCYAVTATSTSLSKVFQLIEDLEECVASFNNTFFPILFLETTFSFMQIMFALYSGHLVNPLENFALAANVMLPILMYTTCLVSLCVASSEMTSECQEMVGKFQQLPASTLSTDDGHKIQLLVARLAAEPTAIHVAQLFLIRVSLLGSALNTIATYFIVIVQMRLLAHSAGIDAIKTKESNESNIVGN